MKLSNTDNFKETVEAKADITDIGEVIANMRKNHEPLVHCAVYILIAADGLTALKDKETMVEAELSRAKLAVDHLILRQKEGYLYAQPGGKNILGYEFERVLPASSAANLYPFSYSGKADPHGFRIGKDRYGTNIFVDFNQRSLDRTNANILILGNAGQGKSYLLKLIITNLLEQGMRVITLDPEEEYQDLTLALGGDYLDLMDGNNTINVLEPKLWNQEGKNLPELNAPEAFQKKTVVSQHLAFLRDFFRTYKNLSDAQLDVVEILVRKLYLQWHISDHSDLSQKNSEEYPILSDLYALADETLKHYGDQRHAIYTEELLRSVCLALYSISSGADSRFFNGHTNIKSSRFVTFGVKSLLSADKNLRDAMLFNVLSYMSDQLLSLGNTVATLDEFYLFLSNKTAVEYIRNFSKRVRKRDSALIIASQNLEDFELPEIKELTKPLFAIPTHQFLFNSGTIDSKFYMDTLGLTESEFQLILHPRRGTCLYRCGMERYCLEVEAPDYKQKLFGNAAGR